MADKMHGRIVGPAEAGGWIANINHPVSLIGVELPQDALCLTRGYQNPNARTRITDTHAPDQLVSAGDAIVASVATITEETGNVLRVPGRTYWDDPTYVRKVVVVGTSIVKWGLKR
jgi:hypothetical protein